MSRVAAVDSRPVRFGSARQRQTRILLWMVPRTPENGNATRILRQLCGTLVPEFIRMRHFGPLFSGRNGKYRWLHDIRFQAR